MPIHRVDGGFKWGSKGKVYKTRAGAERQAAAAHANGFVEKKEEKMKTPKTKPKSKSKKCKPKC